MCAEGERVQQMEKAISAADSLSQALLKLMLKHWDKVAQEGGQMNRNEVATSVFGTMGSVAQLEDPSAMIVATTALLEARPLMYPTKSEVAHLNKMRGAVDRLIGATMKKRFQRLVAGLSAKRGVQKKQAARKAWSAIKPKVRAAGRVALACVQTTELAAGEQAVGELLLSCY